MSTPEACIIQSATVDSASADLNTESDSDMDTACRQDVSYPGDAFARTEVSSAVAANSADQHSDATKDYDSRKVYYMRESSPATANSALETLDAENGSDVARQQDVNTTYIGDKSEHAEVRSAVVVDSADTGPQVEDNLTGDPMETLRLHYLAIAATEAEQKDDVDDSKINIFERSGTDLDLTDYAHKLAFLPDLTEVKPTELD
ncbi:hypothetical protein PInf_023287 [Phytophthora infestans]|nr:hypothetical protein PInf_023287 [Phytophthora infestans]